MACVRGLDGLQANSGPDNTLNPHAVCVSWGVEENRGTRTGTILPLGTGQGHIPARESLRPPRGLLVYDWCEGLWQPSSQWGTSGMQEGEDRAYT